MKNFPVSVLGLVGLSVFTSACFMSGGAWRGSPQQAGAGAAAATAETAPTSAPSETVEPVPGEPEEAVASSSATGGGSATVTVTPAGELDTAALCTKASTCTTSISIALCGMLNPRCLDAFHKHNDGATREGCQAKLDRIPGLVQQWAPPGYQTPEECR